MSEEIYFCAYLQNLNYAMEKDTYPMLPMEKILQTVSECEIFCFLDEFWGYN